MQIEPSAAVDAFSRLADPRPAVMDALAISVMRETLDTQASAVQELLSTLQPHLGQRVDVRV
ncbi:MAG: putative motility protein [Chloroflexota bacterium]